MNFLKKYFPTIGYLVYLIGLIIFIICHKYNYQILTIPTILLVIYVAVISICVSSPELHRLINKVGKFLIFFLFVYEIATLLLINLINIKWPKVYKHILFLTPTTTMYFVLLILSYITIFLLPMIIFSSTELKLNKKTFVAIIDLLILIYSICIITSTLINTVFLLIKDNIINYASTIFINCSFLISFGLIRIIDKDNPLHSLVFNKGNYSLIWPFLSSLSSLTTILINK